ncbi:MAG: HD-GYP domain-containing protein [Vulcanimicrobiota bacterium]
MTLSVKIRCQLFRLAVVALALLFFVSLTRTPAGGLLPWGSPWWGLAFFLGLAALAERRPLLLPRYGAMSLAGPAAFAVMILYGPLATVCLTLTAGLSRFLRESRERELEAAFMAYSLAQGLLSYGLGASLFAEYGHRAGWLLAVVSMAVAVVATFLIQSQLVAVHQWLEQGMVGLRSGRVNWERLRLYLVAVAPLGALLAVSMMINPAALALTLAPLIVTYLSIKNYTDTLREAREVVESLVEAVERREPHMVGHARRVADYAADIARQLGLKEPQVARVATAGRMHDLGKIGIDESILAKREALSREELDLVRCHPEIGAQVAARLSLSREEAEFIRYHHEWYDGGGYPYGLRGQAIPLGARILAVAEAFDTMMTNTVYACQRTATDALEALREGRGTQFDPEVVDALTEALNKRRKFSLPSSTCA